MDPFDPCPDPEALAREKRKARELRRSQWWKRRCAKGVCDYCGRPTPPGELTMDHIVPLSRGGRSRRGNVVPACKDCNSRKQHLLPTEWALYLDGLRRDRDGPDSS